MALPEKCQQCGRLVFPDGLVTISADEYQELLQFRQARDTQYGRLSAVRLASRSRIARDPELAKYIVQCAETMLLRETEAACVARFGRARVPSKSAIHRFIYGVAHPSRK